MVGILGASGYIGEAFTQELVRRDIAFLEFSRKKDNYYEQENLLRLLYENNINLLINCAGFVGKPNVDAVEDNKDEAYKANVELARNVASSCSVIGTTLIHISSGCIYSGYEKEYTEADAPNFAFGRGSYYSGTKALAEQLVYTTWPETYICRLRIPFDEYDNDRNVLTKLQKYDKLLEAKNSISHRGDFVKACIDLHLNQEEHGTYNIVNTGPVTTKGMVAKINEILKVDKKFEFFKDDAEFYKIGAKAPRSNCVLDNSKLLSKGISMRSTEEALDDSLKNWKKI